MNAKDQCSDGLCFNVELQTRFDPFPSISVTHSYTPVLGSRKLKKVVVK